MNTEVRVTTTVEYLDGKTNTKDAPENIRVRVEKLYREIIEVLPGKPDAETIEEVIKSKLDYYRVCYEDFSILSIKYNELDDYTVCTISYDYWLVNVTEKPEDVVFNDWEWEI